MNNIKLSVDEISTLEESKYFLESHLDEFMDIDFEKMNVEKMKKLGEKVRPFDTAILIKFTIYLLENIEDIIIDKYYDGKEIQIKCEAQNKYCGDDTPFFAPPHGRCWNCNGQIWKHISLKKASNELITGCPICNRTYCD